MEKTKQIILTFLFAIFFLVLSSNKVYANDAYFLAVTIDDASNCYRGEIITESGGDHREVKVAGFSKYFTNDHIMDSSKKLPNTPSDDTTDIITYYGVDATGTNSHMYFTFPPIHSVGFLLEKVDASDKDLALAQRVVDYPLAGLNDAISFIITNTGWKKNESKESIRDIGMHLGNYDTSFTVNGKSVTAKYAHHKDSTISQAKDISNIGITKDDWMQLTVDGNTQFFVYQCNKGYYYADETTAKNDPLYYMSSSRYNEYTAKLANSNEPKKMTWRMLVLQGNFNYDNGTSYSSITNISAPSEFESVLTGLMNTIVNQIRTFLGLYSLDELMTNNGQRDSLYNLGMFPNTWTDSAILVHIICQMIAWALIGFSIVKMLWKKQLSTMNVSEKISLQEGIKNLILCGMLLGSFTLVFNFLARLNYRLVDLFTASTTSVNLSTAAGASSTFGGVLVSLLVLGLTIYFNFYYIVRAVQLAILYGIAPLCIYTLSLGGKVAGTFTTFMKELLGNLFTQSIHALCIAFFSNVFISGNTRAFEQIVIMYSFIPIGNFIRKKVFGLEDGVAGQATQLAQGAVSSIGAGIAGKASDKLNGSKSGGGKSGGKSGGSGSSDSSLNQAIDNKVSNATGNSDITMKDSSPMGGGYKEGFLDKPVRELNKGMESVDRKIAGKANAGIQRITGKSKDYIKQGTVSNAVRNTPKAARTISSGVIGGVIAGSTAALGLATSVSDPQASKALLNTAGNAAGNAFNNTKQGIRSLAADNNLRNSLRKNGISSAKFNKDFSSYQLDGNFDKDGMFKGNNGNDNLNQSNIADYNAMYKAQDALARAKFGGDNYSNSDFNHFTTKDIEKAKGENKIDKDQAKVLSNMVRQQVRLNKNNNNSYSVIRRSEDIKQMNNAYDRANPLAGLNNVRGRNDNANKYSNRETTQQKPSLRN